MTIDKNTLDLAREWRKDIDRGAENFSQDYIDAAAEVIQALPEVIVDGDKLREIVDRAEEGLQSSGNFLRSVKELLSAPAPLVEVKLGAWAMHPKYGKVMIVSSKPDPNGDVQVCWEDKEAHDGTIVWWVNHADLSPVPPATPTEQAAPTQDNSSSGHSADREPKDSDVPAGDAWLVEFEGSQCYGVRDWAGSPEWTVVDSDGDRRYAEDEELRRITRLVPATEPRQLSTVEDYEDAPVGTVLGGDGKPTREKIDKGLWSSTIFAAKSNLLMSANTRTVLWEPQS